ncbi:MAG: SatD family protein [Candidatus Methylomirabilales bacterium]
MPNRFYVLLIDIVRSARLPNRAAATERLEAANGKANTAFADDLFAPFEITRGDESAAVLTSVARAYEMVSSLSDTMQPVTFRSVLVYDELTAGLDSRRSSVIDGPAFYRANEMMQALKRTQKTFALAIGHEELDGPTEALVNLLQWRWSLMTDLQRQIVRLYQQDRNQSRVGAQLGRSQQQISHALNATKWELIDAGEAAIRHLFRLIDRRNTASQQEGGK